MSAPSMTTKAEGSVIRPWPTKDATMSAVAVLDWISAVTPMPEIMALNQLLTLVARMLRKFAPKTRRMPVRTDCAPQTSKAMAASRLSRWVNAWSLGVGLDQWARRTRSSSSRMRQAAPRVIAASATLKAGKCQPRQ